MLFEIIAKCIEEEKIALNIKIDYKKINKNLAMLIDRIVKSINNDSLNDFECIEEIINILDEAGIQTSRHDF